MNEKLIELAKAKDAAWRQWEYYAMQDISSATWDQIVELAVCCDFAYQNWFRAKVSYDKAVTVLAKQEAALCA